MKQLYKNTLKYIFSKERILIYFNYSVAFSFSLIFLILAKNLNLNNLEKYILIISISAVFSSIFYSVAMKSIIGNGLINIGLSKKTLVFLSFCIIFISAYLISRDKLLIIFFFLSVIFEIILNLSSIYFIKNGKTKNHSFLQLFNGLLKISTLFFLINYTNDILDIIGIYYIICLILFFVFYKKLNLRFAFNEKSFNLTDLLFVISGSLIFQLDKIVGESKLSVDDIFLYYLIFKLSSIFQILGNILTQPVRNKILIKGLIYKKEIYEINFFIKLILFGLIISNLTIYLLFEHIFINFFDDYFNIYSLIIFNMWSVIFILHTLNGFYIDSLFINGYSKKILILNTVVLIQQFLIFLYFESLIIWSISILIGQIILTFISLIFYDKYIRNKHPEY